MVVVGRESELADIESWISASLTVPTGPVSRPTVLEIEGEAGIGKTTLWAEVGHRAVTRGWTVLTCRPSASDAPLSFVGLADLLASIPDSDFEALPAPQRRPLEVALLRAEAGEGDLDRRAVGTGLTALRRTLADRAPLLLGVDDCQWLDTESAWAVGFCLRRLEDRPVLLMAAARPPGSAGGGHPSAFAAIESDLGSGRIHRVRVGPLSVAAIHRLLRDRLGARVPRPTLVRIHRAARGNPFYALEIAREVLLRGPPAPGEPIPIPADHGEIALLRLRRLPASTRQALMRVAAMSRPETRLVDSEALVPAVRAGLIVVTDGGRLEFTHPLFGSALYSALSEQERRGVHNDLATRVESLEERARHQALGADGPDEATADLLDQAADSAAARGAAGAAVELKELARRLTPASDSHAVARRDLELANRRYFAGDAGGARRELERSLGQLAAGEDRALVLLELGSVMWTENEAEAGLALITQALEEAESPALLARIHSRASSMAIDADEGLAHAERALALIDERDDPLLYSFALHNMAMWKLYAGEGADHEAIRRGMELQQETAAWEVSTCPRTGHGCSTTSTRPAPVLKTSYVSFGSRPTRRAAVASSPSWP